MAGWVKDTRPGGQLRKSDEGRYSPTIVNAVADLDVVFRGRSFFADGTSGARAFETPQLIPARNFPVGK